MEKENISVNNEDKKEEMLKVDSMPHAEEKKNKKSLSLFKTIIYAIIGIIILVIIIQIVVADKYKAQVVVIPGEKKVGVNPTTEKLDFGDLSADTSAARYISLEEGGMDTAVFIVKFGSIAELIKVSDSSFKLSKGDQKRVEFSLYMPPSAPVGEKYTGHVWVFKMPKLW